MKKSIGKAFVILAVLSLVLAASAAMASDTLVQAKVSDVKEKLDKNGSPFSIIVIQEERTLNGVTYSADVICTAFRQAHEEAKTLKPGDTVKMIAAKRDYNGDAAYTVRKILK
jgi:signal-transduction protein with cAMP-binding, CBS, and nucleotidyltransferase domain